MINIKYFSLLLVIMRAIQAQMFLVSLNDSLNLNANISITTINIDFDGNFFVGFIDGSARRYAPDFSSYINLSFPEAIYLIECRGYSQSTTLSNGTLFSMSARKIITKSNNFTTVRDYNYNSHANQENYQTNETILNEIGFPFTVSNVSHFFHVMACISTIKVAYRGVVAAQIPYSSIFSSSAVGVTAIHYGYPMSISVDQISGSYIFYLSLSNKYVYKLTVNLKFMFNFTIDHYDITSVSCSSSLVYAASTLITNLKVSYGILMMQSNSTGVTAIYDLNNSRIGATVNIPLNQTFSFFYAYGNYYILQSTGISLLTYDAPTSTLTFTSLIVSLAYNTYDFSFGSLLDPFYIPGLPYIYKGGICTGQSLMSGSKCSAYNCSVGNCSFCSISASICSICSPGFALTSNFTCIEGNNSISNLSIIEELIRNSFSFFDTAISISKSVYSNMIAIPAARKTFTPAFMYFTIFDDLYLYQFHDRIYGSTLNDMFVSISIIESKKWSLINYQTILDFVHLNYDAFQNFTSYQVAYVYYNFSDADHTDVGPEGLWENCQNFFLVTIPLTLIGFLILRGFFKLWFKLPISLFVRKYQFWPLLFVILLEGNIQQLAFYLSTEWKNMFSFAIGSKLMKIICVYFGFSIVFLSAGLYFISHSFYLRLNRYLMDNNRNDFKGQILLICQFGVKNLYFGIMHSFLRGLDYDNMLVILLISEVVFNLVFLISVAMKMYKLTGKMWLYLSLNLIKILLIATLFVDYQNINIPIVEDTQQFLIATQILIFLVGIIHQAVCVIRQTISIFKAMFREQVEEPLKLNQTQFLKKQLSHSGIIAYISNFDEKQSQQKFGNFLKVQEYPKAHSHRYKSNQNFGSNAFSSSKSGLDSRRVIIQAKKRYFKIKYESRESF